MTTGEGIFFSTALLISTFFVWQITLHHKWKIVGKWLAVLGIAGVLFGFGLWRWKIHNGRPQPAENPRPQEAQTELGGVRLGSTQLDVQLVRGKPDKVTAPAENNNHAEWYYSPRVSGDYRLTVIFDGDIPSGQPVVRIICANGSGYGLLGIDFFEQERTVLEQLGEPSNVSIRADGLAKLISYEQWNAAFQVEEGSVRAVCISSSGKVRFGGAYPGFCV